MRQLGRTFTVKVEITEGAYDEDLNARELLAHVTITDGAGRELASGGSGSPVKDVKISFENTYDIKKITVPLRAHKTLTGAELEAGDFAFELAAVNGAPMPGSAASPIEAKNDATGYVQFGSLTFNALRGFKCERKPGVRIQMRKKALGGTPNAKECL